MNEGKKLTTGWCSIYPVNVGEGEVETWIGNIREVGETESEVEVPSWDEISGIETIEHHIVPNEFLTMKRMAHE